MSVSVPFQLTHVNTEDALIKIWGLVDRERHAFIQNIIEIHNERLCRGYGMPSSHHDLVPGKSVLVAHGSRFKRAQIIRTDPTSSSKKIIVRLLDVGSVVNVDLCDIRDVSEVVHLKGMDDSPLAEDFILYGAVRKNPWNPDHSEWANRILLFNSEITLVDVVAGKGLLNVFMHDTKLSGVPYTSLLLKRGLIELISLEQQKTIIMAKYGMQIPNNFSVPPPGIPDAINIPRQPYSYPMSNSSTPSPPGFTNPVLPPPGFNMNYTRTRSPRNIPQQQLPPATQILPRQFAVETLKPDTTHEVYVSYVIDGMQSFTVQLKVSSRQKMSHTLCHIC